MTRKTPIFAAALIGFAAPALAGNTLPAADPVVATPAAAPLSYSNTDWTGFYAGGQLGYANIDTNVTGQDDGFIGGLNLGYDYDFGKFVMGAGLDYDFADISLGGGAATVENVFRVKLRGGYEVGPGLLYATTGYAQAETDTLGSDDGYFIGAGYETMLTENVSLASELLYHEFNSFNGTNADVEATTVHLRASFRF